MLKAVSFKGEIILTTSVNVGNELHIEELVQLHEQVVKHLGFAHFLVLSTVVSMHPIPLACRDSYHNKHMLMSKMCICLPCCTCPS